VDPEAPANKLGAPEVAELHLPEFHYSPVGALEAAHQIVWAGMELQALRGSMDFYLIRPIPYRGTLKFFFFFYPIFFFFET
jgi:hypothetical protein